MLSLGIDTSNYATSMAVFDNQKNKVVCEIKKFLPVKKGELGLRQSDALFHHTMALPDILKQINNVVDIADVDCVGVSSRPRPQQGSYMPCFMAGLTFATGISTALKKPLIQFSHQEGHIAAAIFATNKKQLLNEKLIVFHISGGTTEMLLCNGTTVLKKIGESTDLYAGQAVDRLGVSLGYDFPAGRFVSALASECLDEINPKVSVKDTNCSFSGLQNQCEKLIANGSTPQYAAKYCLVAIAKTINKMVYAARNLYGELPVICAGGVMSSNVIKMWMQQNCSNVYFVDEKFSSDNAIGLAVLAAAHEV